MRTSFVAVCVLFAACTSDSVNPRGMGIFCSDDGDCDRAICGLQGVCTIACLDPEACIAGWVCTPSTRQCTCTGGGELGADGNDNDCDGVVDETGPGTDAERPDVGCSFEQEGFESGSLPSGWSSTGDANWRIVPDSDAPEGEFVAMSGNISHSEDSGLTTVFFTSQPSTLSFSHRTSSESCCDELHVYVNGTELGEYTASSWSVLNVSLEPGANTVEWRYEKDASVSSGSDATYIDDIQVRCDI